MESPGTLTAHGRAGRERVEARFSMEAMVEGYLAVYDEVLRGKRCAA
jgi:glycosyltransferase involved in cell wall biosynthesis